MGSDNKPRSIGRQRVGNRWKECCENARIWCARNKRRILSSGAAASFLLYAANRILPPPEVLFFDSFVPSSADVGANSSLPAQCQATADQVYRCQQDEATPYTLVLGCHRRWCNSFGHCDACCGIGDRFFNFGMNHIHHAMSGTRDYPRMLKDVFHGNNSANKNDGNDIVSAASASCTLRIELDYPAPGMSVLRSAIYQDPSGWWGELFRYRSYRPVGHTVSPQFLPGSTSKVVSHLMGNKLYWQSGRTHEPAVFKIDWDPCLFHAYFRPNSNMEQELNYHQQQLNGGTDAKKDDTAVIGIHFRTGDGLSFAELDIPDDVRIKGGKTLQTSWEQMKQCAQELAQSSPIYSGKKHIRYLLASDSLEVKHMARKEIDMEIYTTDVRPSNFRGNPDRDTDAWMELFLLSRQDGFVMNKIAEKTSYKGKAGSISAFAKLVERIGFFRKDQVRVCEI